MSKLQCLFPKFSGRILAFLATIVAVAVFRAEASASTLAEGTHRIDVDFSQPAGKIRPLQGMDGGPMSDNFTVDLSGYFRELQVPYVRFHTPNWPNPLFVSVQFIFPDMAADPDDPANYDFKLTDQYVAAIVAVGAKPIYGLGLGLDTAAMNNNRYYKTKTNVPPADFKKWARVCVNIARHYNEGWANGTYYDIEHWEVWNEPNLKSFWAGTEEQFVDLYAEVATALKRHNPSLKVGGPGLYVPDDGTFDWLERFLAACRQRGLPLDFCSWHFYHKNPAAVLDQAGEVQRLLEQHGYPKAENIITEWSPLPMPLVREDPLKAREFWNRTGSSEGGSFDVSVLCYLQDSPVDIATFYSGETLRWGFADRNGAPKTSYFAFKAFRRMLDTPVRVAATGNDLPKGVAVLAGLAPDGLHAGILVSNYRADCKSYEIHVRGLPWGKETVVTRQVVDQTHELELVATDRFSPGGTFVITTPAGASSVQLLQLAADGAAAK